MTCPDVTDNSDLLEGKPRGSTTVKALIDDINSIIQTNLIDTSCDIETQSSILTATGIWLDYIGERLKYPRPLVTPGDLIWFGFDDAGVGFDQLPFTPGGESKVGIDDESYRALLIVRGGQLLTDCSLPSLDSTIQGAFGSGHYIDNGNMTMDVILDDSQPDIIIIATVESGLVTKPAGVRIENIYIHATSGNFGFDDNGFGFDQAPFIRTFEELLEQSIIPTYLIDGFGNNLTDDAGNLLIV